MTQSDSFVQRDVLIKYESEFSWTSKDWNSTYFSKSKEIKNGSCEIKWKLTLIAGNGYDGDYLQIEFRGENLGSHTGILTFKVKQLNYANGYQSTTKVDKSMQIAQHDSGMKHQRILKRDLHLDGKVFCGTIIILNCDCTQKPNKKKLLEENIIQLQEDIHTPLKKKLFTDFKIKVHKTCFPVHKFILRARSPVFDKILEHDTKESQDNCITVTDTNENVMENFISFLYSGSLEDDSFDTVIGLYSLADKYEVTSLLETCRKVLISCISETTVLEILKKADLHTDEELKQKAAQFMCDQFFKIEVSPEWSSLIDSNTRLASYVLRFVSAKHSSNN